MTKACASRDSSAPDPADEAAIRLTFARYCQHCDDGLFDEWAQCFTEDATFTVMGATHSGRADVQAWIENAQPPERRGKHFLGQSIVDIEGDRATGVTDYIFIGKGENRSYGITSAGRYVDTLRREPDGVWRIASREIVFL
jgi:3-phenylpropionate/cinnamic acid dioxygenase small subunit